MNRIPEYILGVGGGVAIEQLVGVPEELLMFGVIGAGLMIAIDAATDHTV